MKDCELCGLRARMHCESDQASLCWDCDEKVHGANFLVAKHTRSLLCHVCHSPTPWKASGPKLTPTVSVCETCVDCHGRRFERGPDDGGQGGNDESQGGNDEDQDDLVDDDEIAEVDSLSVDGDYEDFSDEDGENQVVPWSFSSPPPPPAVETATVAYSSTTSEEEERLSVSKRMGEDADPDSDDEATSSGSFRSEKRRRLSEDYGSVRAQDDDGQTESSRSTAIIASLQRLTNDAITDVDSASATILGICKLSRDQSR